MQTAIDSLPEPDAALGEHSRRLVALIHDEIDASGGSMPFSRYMELALYAPGLGYYSSDLRKFGEQGDFVTAPELSPLFSRCLARNAAEVLTAGGDVLEFGAGSGVMAAGILLELERLGQLPRRYFIIELSAGLRRRQDETIARMAPHLRPRVEWLDRLPRGGFRGIMLANEVLDAMPVERFQWQDGVLTAMHVVRDGEGFGIRFVPAGERLRAAFDTLRARLPKPLPDGYRGEINLHLPGWLATVADTLEQGVLLLIDYGSDAGEIYHPERHDGTLMCHYRHRAHPDPFRYPGLQDITAWVDFTAVADAALAAGCPVAGYNTQALFLLASGLEAMLAEIDPADSVALARCAGQIRQLTLPGEMGERFKCMAVQRGEAPALPGFALQDLRHRL